MDAIKIIFDAVFFLYAKPFKRSGSSLRLERVDRSPKLKYTLRSLQVLAVLQRLISLLFRVTTDDISGYLLFHFGVVGHTVVGLSCAITFIVKADVTIQYFHFLYFMLQDVERECSQ